MRYLLARCGGGSSRRSSSLRFPVESARAGAQWLLGLIAGTWLVLGLTSDPHSLSDP
jgi:hypothetical protein